MNPILPGATIGIFGGGQLGRMMAAAAHSLGYKVCILDPDPQCSARSTADIYIRGSWADRASAAHLALSCDVVTLEIEQIAGESLDAAQRITPVRPGSAVMDIVRNRIAQKTWLRDQGLPLGPWLPVESAQQLRQAVTALQATIYLKSAEGGYDGRSQVRLDKPTTAELEAAWLTLGSNPCVAEQSLDLLHEISVLVARSPQGETKVFPPALNHHEKQVLAWSVLPAPIHAEIGNRAQDLARQIAQAIELEGLLAVEMFITRSGNLFVNELAPRPHNSYHASTRACATNQFEQAIRAVCGLPLGSTDIIRPAAIANLLGDLWLYRQPNFEDALAIESVQVHLYGKSEPRAGRKMGHLSAVGSTPEQAVARVLEAHRALSS